MLSYFFEVGTKKEGHLLGFTIHANVTMRIGSQ